MDKIRKIPLTQGKFAIVDADDFEEVSKHKWRLHNKGYAYFGTRENRKCRAVLMHRLINNTPDNMQTDHINGNKLDNRKSNLRSCSVTENNRNRGKHSRNTAGYKGVCHKCVKGKYNYWVGQLHTDLHLCGVQSVSKHFPYTEQGKIDAARWYNEQVSKHHGEFARLNEV